MTAPTRGPRGPYAKTAERRAHIAEAAYEVVMEVGHPALTTAAVAERAGISERTMLYHFPSRDHLLVAAIEHFEQVMTEGRVHLPWTPGTFDRIITDLAHRAQADDRRLQLQVALAAAAQDPNHPAHEYFSRHYDEALAEMGKLIAAMQQAGEAHPDRDPRQMARMFIAVWDGLQQQWLIRHDFDLAAEILTAFREISGQAAMEARQAVEDLLARI
ncbi:MAG TPA: TetR/AcrR family transcriptional regulator [Arachnia sp.]|nr:TetR/AcrR family transcriptional regulator [Arachnia sp.]